MKEIYSNCDRVVAWLGQGDANSDLGMDNITRFLDLDALATDSWDQTCKWMSVLKLFDRSYWSRLWIVQELVLAKTAIIKCGDREVHMEDFTDAIDLIRSKDSAIRRLLRCSYDCDEICETLDRLKTTPASRLLDMIRSFFMKKTSNGNILAPRMTMERLVGDLTPFAAKDPRDVIYAILALAKDSAGTTDPMRPKLLSGSLAPLRPNYHRSILDVYADFTAHSVHSSGTLDLICRPWAPLSRNLGRMDPSIRICVLRFLHGSQWIQTPVRRSEQKHSRRQNGDSLVGKAQRRIYSSDNGMPAQVRFGVGSSGNTFYGSLYAKGLIIGEITRISTRMGDGIVLKECVDMLGNLDRSGEGGFELPSERIWRTLSANRDSNGDAAPSLYLYAMLHILQKLSALQSIDTVELMEQDQPEHLENFLERMQAVIWDRKIFQARAFDDSGEHLVGLAPREAQENDWICILYGCSVPVILRRHEVSKGLCWELVGECYVDGKMEGEALCGLVNTEIEALTSEFELR